MKIKNSLTKILSLVMCLSLMLCIAACSDDTKENPSESGEDTSKTSQDANTEMAKNNEKATSEEGTSPDTDKNSKEKENEKMSNTENKRPIATITMDNGKQIKVELYPEDAPVTVENFISLAEDGFYDGLTFHRIIEGFMIQGGDPEGTGMGGSDENIYGEFLSNGFDNPIKHERGVISMARSMDPDSASSQFFIMHEDAPHLDGNYAAFGKVFEGIEVVDEIATVSTDMGDRPLTPVVMESITISYID